VFAEPQFYHIGPWPGLAMVSARNHLASEAHADFEATAIEPLRWGCATATSTGAPGDD